MTESCHFDDKNSLGGSFCGTTYQEVLKKWYNGKWSGYLNREKPYCQRICNPKF